jgi:hypothetical protein
MVMMSQAFSLNLLFSDIDGSGILIPSIHPQG